MKKIRNLSKSKLAKNSFIYSSDFVLQILVQALYAILISRALGPSQYGYFASLTAISVILSVISGWGCDQVLIQNVTRKLSSFNKSFGSGLVLILITYPILLLASLIFFYFITKSSGINLISFILFTTVDIVFTKTIFLCKACFAAFEDAKRQLYINIVTTSVRLCSLLLPFLLLQDLSLNSWSYWYFFGALISAIYAYSLVVINLGWPNFTFDLSFIKIGTQFWIEQLSLATLKDLDKPIVLSIVGAEQGGFYAAAFKIVDAATSPIRGILYAAYVRYFKLSVSGAGNALNFAKKITPALLIISLILAGLIYSLAWLVPYLLGDKYEPSVLLVKQLCFYPMLLGMLGTGVDLIRGMDKQIYRTYVMIGSSLINLPILYLCLFLCGVSGAAYAKNIVLILTICVLYLIINKLVNKKSTI